MTKPPASRSAALFPRPDRSDQTPNRTKTAENAVLDLGWNEGVLRDGRPWRLEAWVDDGVTTLTYFFARRGIRARGAAGFATLLEREGLLRFTGAQRFVQALPLVDAAGNALWSVNVVAGDEDGNFVDDTVRLLPYALPQVDRTAPARAPLTGPRPRASWRQFEGALAASLAGLADGVFLVVADSTTHHFVQFASGGAEGMRAEAKSNAYIEEEENLLGEDEHRALLALGWTAPTYEPTVDLSGQPEGSPNYHLNMDAPVAHAALAALAVRTLREVYAVGHPRELRYECAELAGH